MSHHDEHNHPAIDRDLLLERLVTGGMARSEEDALLARCELEPDLARAAMLAFVEERRLAVLLRDAVGCGAVATPRTTSSGVRRSRWLSLATAASLLVLGAIGGYGFGARGPAGQGGGPLTNGVPTTTAAADRSDLAAAAREFAALTEETFSPAARQALRDAGIEVHEQPRLYVIDGPNGEYWAIPEKEVHVRFVKHE